MQLVFAAAPVGGSPLIEVDLGAGGVLRVQNGGSILHGDGLIVNGAVQQEHQGLGLVLHGGVDDLVHVGQLLALGIDLPVVGVADELIVLALDAVLAGLGGQDKGVQGGDSGVVPEVVQHLLAGLADVGEFHAADFLGSGQSLRFLGGLGVAVFHALALDDQVNHLLKDMLGSVVPLEVNGQSLDEVVLGSAEGHGEGGVINLFHHGGIAVGILMAGADALAVHLVQTHGVVEPYAVLSGERLAVGPLHALAQINGVDGVVIVDIIALGHVGLNGAGGVETEQAFLDGLAGVPVAAAGGTLQLTAVNADFQGVAGSVHGLDHHVVRHGQTVLHLAVGTGGSEEGSLGEHHFLFHRSGGLGGSGGLHRRLGFGGSGGGGGSGASGHGAQAQNQCQNQRDPLFHILHVFPPNSLIVFGRVFVQPVQLYHTIDILNFYALFVHFAFIYCISCLIFLFFFCFLHILHKFYICFTAV